MLTVPVPVLEVVPETCIVPLSQGVVESIAAPARAPRSLLPTSLARMACDRRRESPMAPVGCEAVEVDVSPCTATALTTKLPPAAPLAPTTFAEIMPALLDETVAAVVAPE